MTKFFTFFTFLLLLVSQKAFSHVASPGITATTSQTNVTCKGLANGQASITSFGGGTAPYTFAWSNGATTEDISNLQAGVYSYTVTDAVSFTFISSVTITEPALVVSSTSSVTNVPCNGSTNGSATITATGGTAPYTYAWSSGGTAAIESNLSGSVFSYTVTDAKLCQVINTVSISQPAALTSSVAAINITCNGFANGSATVTTTGGTTPYTHYWSNGSTAAVINNLMGSVYTNTLTDANGCMAVASATITQPSALTQTISATNVTCNNGSNGSATVTPSGGTTPYTYAWSNGSATPIINSLVAGVYTNTLTDGNGCTSVSSTTITQPATLLVPQSSITTSISCNGELAVVTVTATGGATPYNGVGTFSVIAGINTFTVTDNNSCALTTSVNITEPDAIMPLSSITSSVLCNGGNAVVTVTATGGTGALTGLANYTVAAGVQTYTVTDDNSCAVTTTINVTEPAILVASATSSTSCGLTNSSVQISATGGTTPYTSVGTFTAAAGDYTYTVTDANSCSSTTTITVLTNTNAVVPTFNVGSIAAGCVGLTNGSAWTRTVSTTGLFLPLTYSWSPSAQTTQTATTLAPGSYTCDITDANGCVYSKTVNVGPSAPLSLSVTVAPSLTVCPGTSTSLSVLGAASYTWSNGANTSSIVVTPTVTTDYTVTGTSFLGCTLISTLTIVTSTATCLGFNEADLVSASVYPNPTKDVLTVNLTKNYNNCSIQLFDAFGKLVLSQTINGTETTIQTSNLDNGIYFYQIKSNDIILSRNKLIKQ